MCVSQKLRKASFLGMIVATSASASCGGDPDGGYDVAVRVSARVPVLESVEVVLSRDPCSSATLSAGSEPASVVARWRGERTSAMDEPPLGVVAEGRYGLFARGFARSCQVVAAGCGVARVDANGTGELEVLLRRIEGPGCAIGQTCGVGGLCVGEPIECGADHVGPWRDANALPDPRAFAAIVVHRGEIVVVGGGRDRGSSSTDVFVASTSGGAGIGTWSMSTPLPTAVSGAGIASDGERIYVIGGASSGSATAAVMIARDGSTREWSSSDLPAPRVDHGVALAAGALYAIGGRAQVGEDTTASVQRATIEADGSLDAWIDERALPEPSAIVGAFAHRGRLYAFAPDRVFVAVAAEDGLGPWARVESPLPTGGEPAIAHTDDAVFVVGGASSDGAPSTDVYAAALSDDGSIGPYRRVTALPEGRLGARAIAIDADLAVIGGTLDDGTSVPSLLARHCAP